MDFLTFLNTMLTSLNKIEVRGEENLDTVYGCIMATKSMRDSLLSMANVEQAEEKPENTEDGEVDG